MKPSVWYILVASTTILLIIAFFTKNIYFGVACFVMAMYLDKFKGDIPLPKAFEKLKVVHMNEDKKK
ncbi:hypothetical protein ACFIJ5_12815 [Haloimpatiens sp. FM7330]|uniref:hypothetical protein n=1 Tax=Haloimpatiens sp. FM7330 TaxID=3298610 RepID=UPI003629188C